MNDIDEYATDDPYGLETISNFHVARINTTIYQVKRFLKNDRNERILDIGCGKGIITKLIKKELPNISIDAIDISKLAIKTAKREAPGINFIVADACKYKTKKNVYDLILLNNIYEHVDNPITLLKNAKKLLKNSGAIIISTPNRYHIKNVVKIMLGYNIIIPSYHVTEYSIGQIYDHHRCAGLFVYNLITPKFKYEKFSVIRFILIDIFQPLIDKFLIIRKSKNRLGSLLFIVSKKEK